MTTVDVIVGKMVAPALVWIWQRRTLVPVWLEIKVGSGDPGARVEQQHNAQRETTPVG
jgi:hypothetical protein